MSEQDERRIRASDSEREAVVTVLREAMSEGRLTLAEGEERIAAVYAATYRDELPAFTRDLPQAEPPPAAAGPRRAAGPPWAGQRPGQRPPWRADRRRPHPAFGPVAVLAVIAAVWAAAGHVLWPAIVLGILAIMMLKGGGHGCRPRHTDGASRTTQDASA